LQKVEALLTAVAKTKEGAWQDVERPTNLWRCSKPMSPNVFGEAREKPHFLRRKILIGQLIKLPG
jgi:hypothetical protein